MSASLSGLLVDASWVTERRELIARISTQNASGAAGLSVALDDLLRGILRPITIFGSPLYWRDRAANTSQLTGCLGLNFRWSEVLSSAVVSSGRWRAIQVVLRSPERNFNFTDVGTGAPSVDTSTFTFWADGSGDVRNIGWGARNPWPQAFVLVEASGHGCALN